MWVPWLGRVVWRRGREDALRAARRSRPEEEMWLALGMMPLYRVVLTLDARRPGARPSSDPSDDVLALTLGEALGEERALRVLAEARRAGAAEVLLCPRELAEYYCERLGRQSVPCVIEPA